jgi:hypothetical protein
VIVNVRGAACVVLVAGALVATGAVVFAPTDRDAVVLLPHAASGTANPNASATKQRVR